VLRKLFGPERKEMVEGWRRLHNEGLHGLYRLLSVILSRNMVAKACGTDGRGEKCADDGVGGDDDGENGRKDLVVCGIVTLKWTLRRMGGFVLDLAGSVRGQMAGSCVRSNELWGFLRMRGLW